MTITHEPNRITITCAIAEAKAAYEYLRDNGFQVTTTEMTGKQLTIKAKPCEIIMING